MTASDCYWQSVLNFLLMESLPTRFLVWRTCFSRFKGREIKYYIDFFIIVHSIFSRTDIASVVTILGNLLCNIDVY